MAKLFVFGIGGTGARVMKSFIMFLASGMNPGNYDVVPILIDPHKDLKELNDIKSLFRLYSDINNKIFSNTSKKSDSFFNTKLLTLKSLAPESGIKDEFEFDEKYDVPFRNFLELSNLKTDNVTLDLLSLLFTEKNLNDSLSEGFRGNPNVGSIVLNTIKDSQGFKAIESAFGNEDKIFIISSIFGGTGAAGFPLLLKNLRNHSKTIIKEAQIGAVTLMPYFKLTESDESEIDSNSFMTKTKSALTYYIRDDFTNHYNALYYIADPDKQNKPYENNEKEQNNKAHLIELLSALSIFKFANTNFSDRGNVFEYTLDEENISSVNFKNIGNDTREQIAKELVKLFIFSKLNEDNINNTKLPYNKIIFNEVYEKENMFFENLSKFFNNYFIKWLKELSENERQFNALNLNVKNNFHELIIGFELDKKRSEGWFQKCFNLEQIQLEMTKELNSKDLKKLNEQRIYQYIISSYKSISKTLDNKINF